MASGVLANPDCITAYEQLRMKKGVKYVLFALSKDFKEIVVEESGEDKKELSNEEQYREFTSKLHTDSPRYGVFDFEYEIEEGKRNKICFIIWTPDEAKVRQKMVYASSKDSLRKSLTGVGVDIQATDPSEVDYEIVLEKCKKSFR